jgi:hypothetical protein
LEEARRVLEERLSLAEEANDYWGQLSTAHYLGKLTLPQGDFDAALHYHRRSLELAERLGARSRISAETSNLSEVLFYLGDWGRRAATPSARWRLPDRNPPALRPPTSSTPTCSAGSG